MMTAALLIQCLAEGLTELDVHTLAENRAVARLVHSLGATWLRGSAGVAEYRIDVMRALEGLRADRDARGVQDVFRALEHRALNPARSPCACRRAVLSFRHCKKKDGAYTRSARTEERVMQI